MEVKSENLVSIRKILLESYLTANNDGI